MRFLANEVDISYLEVVFVHVHTRLARSSIKSSQGIMASLHMNLFTHFHIPIYPNCTLFMLQGMP